MSYYETRELHKKEELRTRYFIGKLEEVHEAILRAAKNLDYEVISDDLERREIFIENDCSMVITITPFGREHGVDINCDTYSFLDFGKGKRRILEFYNEVNKYVKLKGVSLHPWTQS